ncbi:tRNA-modifying protein YgfZ [Pseudidiomarina piscicola]|uniref:tRNA-modifying protein YgfZ n=1 Tax=Pseudidiomarina piscicola TaxID=2614830 RepID=A0A6S6WQ54_9GAMM|nr:tRNA-modifying protein YgfZ [Pseudidiomarina piscicola]CAB0149837.1 tRNA-modifying protein YgfZ [Pseudidiomarina piscicola]VZT39283.1 tRNA-modifying protein YgfZ [Pseudomonas aeruginosa]
MLTTEFTKAPPEYVTVSLDDHGIIQVTGADTDKFLQGQFTCDMAELDDSQWLHGAHCDNKGKTLSLFRILRHADGVLIVTSKPALEASLNQLQKYGVFSKVEIRDASADFQLVGVFGTAAPGRLAELLDSPLAEAESMQVTHTDSAEVLSLGGHPDQYLCLNYGEQLPTNSDVRYWQALEIERGRATLFSGTIQEFVPQMLNLQALGGISFSKGCYIGQETVARMKYLGKQKRALFRLSGHGEQVSTGATVERQLGENWRRAGTVINAVSRADQHLDVLAVLPSDLESTTRLRIKGDDASLLEIYPLPYKLDES